MNLFSINEIIYFEQWKLKFDYHQLKGKGFCQEHEISSIFTQCIQHCTIKAYFHYALFILSDHCFQNCLIFQFENEAEH